MEINVNITIRKAPPPRSHSSHVESAAWRGKPTIVDAQGKPIPGPGDVECIVPWLAVRDSEWSAFISVCPHGRVNVAPITVPKKIRDSGGEITTGFIRDKAVEFVAAMDKVFCGLRDFAGDVEDAKRGQETDPDDEARDDAARGDI